jgi:hypothetical protein
VVLNRTVIVEQVIVALTLVSDTTSYDVRHRSPDAVSISTPSRLRKTTTCALRLVAPALAGPSTANRSSWASFIDTETLVAPAGVVCTVNGSPRAVTSVLGADDPTCTTAVADSDASASAAPWLGCMPGSGFGDGVCDGGRSAADDDEPLQPAADATPANVSNAATMTVAALLVLRCPPELCCTRYFDGTMPKITGERPKRLTLSPETFADRL